MKQLALILLSISFLHASDTRYEAGEKIYKETCISCHGSDGTAKTDIKLIVGPRALSKTLLTEEQSYQIIKKGAHFWGASADIMPSFESVYDEEELRSITHYIIKKFNPDVMSKIERLYAQSDEISEDKKPSMLKRGKKIYKRHCIWCHGVDAKGDGEATRNPELSIFPYDLSRTLLTQKQMFLYVKYGGQYWGTHKNDMPSWSKKYDDFTLKSVVKYIEVNFRNKNSVK